METQIDTQTDACLRPGSVLRSAETSLRSIGRGTCPENSRGIAAKSQTRGRQARAAICVLAEPMAAAGQPLACGEPPSSEAAALRLRALVQHVRRQSHKTRLRSCPLKTPRGHRAAPGLPSGPFPYTKEALPRIWGAGAAPPPRRACPISGGFSGKWRKPGTRPRCARPPHTLLYEPPRPGALYQF